METDLFIWLWVVETVLCIYLLIKRLQLQDEYHAVEAERIALMDILRVRYIPRGEIEKSKREYERRICKIKEVNK